VVKRAGSIGAAMGGGTQTEGRGGLTAAVVFVARLLPNAVCASGSSTLQFKRWLESNQVLSVFVSCRTWPGRTRGRNEERRDGCRWGLHYFSSWWPLVGDGMKVSYPT